MHSNRLLLASAVLLTAAPALLRIGALETARARMFVIARRFHACATPAATAAAIAAVSRRLRFASCLHQALACEALLRASNVECVFRIGARRQAEKHAFHAWVECDGNVLIGATATPHSVLYHAS